jgi:hypothetical protein
MDDGEGDGHRAGHRRAPGSGGAGVIGIHHGMDEATYHADPCPAPSLSSGIVRAILRSPLHAWHAHPQLNPGYRDRTGSAASDEGTILHALVLGTEPCWRVVAADDWRTKDAKEAREAAFLEGRVAVLARRFHELAAVADSIRPAFDRLRQPGSPEATLMWQEPKYGGAWCRARIDWLPLGDRPLLLDLKTTKMSAAPGDWQRRLVSDYCIQAAWYLRGARACGLRPLDFVFVVAETDPPFATSTMACAPSLMAYAEAQCERALALWQRCMDADEWPGYPTETAYVEAPSWLLARQEEEAWQDEMREEVL